MFSVAKIINIIIIIIVFMIFESKSPRYITNSINNCRATHIITHMLKLPRINDEYSIYKARREEIIFTDYIICFEYTQILTERQFFETAHNLDFKRVPNNNEGENYVQYLKNFQDYCENKYMSYENYKRNKYIDMFMQKAQLLNECLSQPINGIIQLDGRINYLQDQTIKHKGLKQILKECMEPVESACNLPEMFITSLKKSAERLRIYSCLFESYTANSFKKEQLTKFLICTGHLEITNGEKNDKNDQITPDETETTEKLIKFDPKTTIVFQEDHVLLLQHVRYSQYMNVFKVISNENDLNSRWSLAAIFYENKNLLPVIIGEEEKKKCLKKKMKKSEFTATKLMYQILPSTKSGDFVMFMQKIKKVLKNLRKIDKSVPNYNALYKPIEENESSIRFEHFMEMKKRRARYREESYVLYTMRLWMQGFLPLTKQLWEKERDAVPDLKQEMYLEATGLVTSAEETKKK